MATFRDKYSSKFQCELEKTIAHSNVSWKSVVDSGKSFGSLLTDLSKAFDCLPH